MSALELASPGNRYCANCICAFSFPIVDHLFNAPNQFAHWWYTSTTIFPEHIYQYSTQKGVMTPVVRSIFLKIQARNTGRLFAIGYDTRCYFNVRSKADTSQLILPHGFDN